MATEAWIAIADLGVDTGSMQARLGAHRPANVAVFCDLMLLLIAGTAPLPIYNARDVVRLPSRDHLCCPFGAARWKLHTPSVLLNIIGLHVGDIDCFVLRHLVDADVLARELDHSSGCISHVPSDTGTE